MFWFMAIDALHNDAKGDVVTYTSEVILKEIMQDF